MGCWRPTWRQRQHRLSDCDLCGGVLSRRARQAATGREIVIATNSYRAVRGRSVLVSIFDECAFWQDERTARPDVETYRAEVVETALAHVIGDKAEQAYRRSDALEKRRKLMEASASYCEPKANSNVLHLRKGGKILGAPISRHSSPAAIHFE